MDSILSSDRKIPPPTGFKDIIETAAANFRPIVITPDQSLVPLFYQILIPTLRHVPFVSLYDKITVILNTMQLMDIKKPVSGKDFSS